MRLDELRVKRLSLGAEARVIRVQEQRLLRRARRAKSKGRDAAALYGRFENLQWHRKFEVRSHARAAHLAYGFLRDKPYKVLERTARSWPSLETIAKNVKAFGGEKFHNQGQTEIIALLLDWIQPPKKKKE